jgi:hypothetical protein
MPMKMHRMTRIKRCPFVHDHKFRYLNVPNIKNDKINFSFIIILIIICGGSIKWYTCTKSNTLYFLLSCPGIWEIQI